MPGKMASLHILNWLSHWLIRHIANIDRALASYLKGLQGGTYE